MYRPGPACALLGLLTGCVEQTLGELPYVELPADDTAAPDELHGEIVLGGVTTCADPDARSAAPFFEPPEAGDFATAQTAGTTSAQTGWGTSVEDFDGDGHLDVILPGWGAPQLYRGNGRGRLDLVPDAFPPGDSAYAHASAAADADGDGDLDVHLARIGADILYLNDGAGYFTDGTLAAGLGADPYDGVHSAWGDYDGDGDLDLYVANYWTEELHPNAEKEGWYGDPNTLWENDGAGHFVDRTSFLTSRNGSLGFTYSGGWWDVDGDQVPELHVVNDKGYLGFSNTLARWDGACLQDIGEGTGLDIVAEGMGIGAADLNGDEIPDFLVSDWAQLWLLLSDGQGGWYDAAFARGLQLPLDDSRIVAWGVELADLDADGDDDAYIAFGTDDFFNQSVSPDGVVSPLRQPGGVWLQGDDGHFAQVSAEWGVTQPVVGRGFVLADLDDNGWLDVVRRDALGVAHVDLQRCGDAGWLRVALDGPAPNPHGVGAMVQVEAGGGVQTRWIHAGSTNIASSAPLEAHFGLGDVDRVDRVRVTWPDGGVQVFEDVEARQRVTVRRDAR